jgi:SET and MYND domain-containing protein
MRKSAYELNLQDKNFYVHPHLVPDADPYRGRLLRVKASIPSGTVLLVDTPSAIIPSSTSPDATLVCSNLACSRRVPQDGPHIGGVPCPNNCIGEVIWCDATCLRADYSRHQFECLWLKTNASVMRQQETEYDFVTLWHVVRLLAGRDLEMRCRPSQSPGQLPWEKDWGRHWKAVDVCCSYLSSWPESQLKHWRRLVETYLIGTALPPLSLTPTELLDIVCKEETNTFALYPKLTGPLYMIDQPVPRGDSYGLGLYPRAARFNHSCLPNVSNQPLVMPIRFPLPLD